MTFLIKASIAYHRDDGKVCPRDKTVWNDTWDLERLRYIVDLMVFVHCYHLARLMFAAYAKYRGKTNAISGCLNCLLVDCFCFVGTVVYMYTQICYWMDYNDCKEELPNMSKHMRDEIIY